MAEVTIEQSTFERLQRHAKPLVDTPNSVIVRALNALDEKETSGAASQDPTAGIMEFSPKGPLPDVMHTRMLAASIDGQSVTANWNHVLRCLLLRAMERYGDIDQLRRRCAVNIVPGMKDDEGYRYLPQAGVSYQGVNANAAASAIVALANDLGIALDVNFQWRDKMQAAHRGRRARIRIAASHGA